MQTILRLFLTLVLGPVAAATADDSLRVRVLSYNIHHGEGVDRKLELQRIAAVIKSVSPDLVALQEVDKNAKRSSSVDQPAELARLTGMKAIFGGNIPLQGGDYGNAILSNWRIRESVNVSLPNHNNGEQRGVHSATVIVGTKEIRFFATHFDHRSDDSERIASAERINSLVADGDAPEILAGDINATRGSPTLKRLQQQWTIAGQSEQPTIPVGTPKRQIDFVFFRPADRWRVIETKVLDEHVASDHRAILAVLELKPRPELTKARLPRDDTRLYRDATGKVSTATSPQQWENRRREIIAGMHTVMGDFPDLPRKTPMMKVISEQDCGSCFRQLIEYESQPGCMTPAYLCIPKTLRKKNAKPVPAVLCLHPTDNKVGHKVVMGLGGRPNRQYAAELAERGFVTIAPSYPLLANYQPSLSELGWCSGTLKAVWDNMRAIDLLQSFQFVDNDAIGAIGHSLGGHNSIYTAVLDDRINAVVSSCGLDSYLDYYDGKPEVWIRGKGWTSDRYMPKLADYAGRLKEIPFDFHELLAALAPRHTLIIAPLHDGNFRADSVDRVSAAARKVFELHGAGNRLRVEHPDCGHDFPDEMRELAYRMFDEAFVGEAVRSGRVQAPSRQQTRRFEN